MAIAANLTFQPLGDAALIVAPSGDPQDARQRVLRLAAACERFPLPGVTDVVPAFGALGVYFDPATVSRGAGELPGDAVTRWLVDRSTDERATGQAAPRLVELAVCYDGPDLGEVASHAGLTVGEAVARHCGAEYRVGAIGFAPGFAYLEGLPDVLHTPRRATPRTRVPAGAVAIGGPYTGVYPRDSPGGWNLIGRTASRLFDSAADPPAVLRVGDRVRMRPVDEPAMAATTPAATPTAEPATGISTEAGAPALRIVSAGALTTLQDLGRPGSQAAGIGPGGAMDAASLRLANLLAGGPPAAVALEAALVGPQLEALADVTLGVAGALPPTIAAPTRLRLRRGERLDLRRLQRGARCYVATAGGFVAEPPAEGPLAEGAVIAAFGRLGDDRPDDGRPDDGRPDDGAPGPLSVAPVVVGESPLPLHYLRGPQADWLDGRSRDRLRRETYRVAPQSNRMGLRCEGAPIAVPASRQLASQPVAHGAIQVPPDGRPIVLGADRQTLGGYPVIGGVISADLPRLGQLRPGDGVRFVEVDPAEAERRRQSLEQWLAVAAAGIAMGRRP